MATRGVTAMLLADGGGCLFRSFEDAVLPIGHFPQATRFSDPSRACTSPVKPKQGLNGPTMPVREEDSLTL